MRTAFQNALRIAVYFAIGVLAHVLIAQFHTLFYLLDEPPYTGQWSDSGFLEWLHSCLVVIVPCLLTAGALRRRFFAPVVGVVLLFLSSTPTIVFYLTMTNVVMGFQTTWPVWHFDYFSAIVGSVLITVHFVAPVRAEDAVVRERQDEFETDDSLAPASKTEQGPTAEPADPFNTGSS